LGTILLLPPHHRALLKGVIINKFRGDVTLLDSGIRDITAMTGVPVLGVLPYLRDLRIEAEDSLCLEAPVPEQADAVVLLRIVVIRLPHISNFTDYAVLERTLGVRVTYLTKPAELREVDLVIIPGSKNTCADLRFLRESGWAQTLQEARQRGLPLIGICGGYQMLGRTVRDPHGVEGTPGEERGLGLLAVETTLAREKELAQVAGVVAQALPFAAAGTICEGYEIHAGCTVAAEATAPLRITRRRGTAVDEAAGAISDDGLVFGCYLHGFFDRIELRTQLLSWLCQRKGVPQPAHAFALGGALDDFERVADMLENYLDLQPLGVPEKGGR
jgi:adenosylcobyric acid synthase